MKIGPGGDHRTPSVARSQYWTRCGVLRWNEIQRELVARYNLPPAPRANGTYPLPDAKNPFADPVFPFANPPYAARAYSYVSVAQYEALKAAWYYKYQFNRPSPAKVDAACQRRADDRPARLSVRRRRARRRHRRVAQAALPGSLEEITRKAAEQREAALLSGRATASDIAAGLALGKAVAALVINRAARRRHGRRRRQHGDVAGAMPTPPQRSGEISWMSQEIPARVLRC